MEPAPRGGEDATICCTRYPSFPLGAASNALLPKNNFNLAGSPLSMLGQMSYEQRQFSSGIGVERIEISLGECLLLMAFASIGITAVAAGWNS